MDCHIHDSIVDCDMQVWHASGVAMWGINMQVAYVDCDM